MRPRGAPFLLLAVAAAGALAAPPCCGPQRAAALEQLLRQDCGACHGMTLRGGLGPALLPEALAGKPDALLRGTVLDGRPGTPMPAWRGLLNEAEADWLVRRLRLGTPP
ncbi:c-type cytochrome [Pseudomonas sp. MT3]|uniref:c-type cytochrome n=1 Tax=Pseudomonas sp. ATCC 13867 TaxID=1294143 RepID=UPI0002C4F010|nr:cytochrome c [Pseudomonas sp. ATCC 13867]AGI25714.1 hypothetical protein H681_19235 [Pseudomonas sp. ATCC 13867]